MPGDGQLTRYDLAKESYNQVLDATKHQDDKIGRQLTALAFLTAATLVFASKGDLTVLVTLGQDKEPLTTYFMGGFLLCTAASALLLILALASPLSLPGVIGPPRVITDSGVSYLFFKEIAGATKTNWVRQWDVSADVLQQRIVDNYVNEIHNIARRADAKNARFLEGSSFFVLALLFFSLLVVTALQALTSGLSPSSTTATPRSLLAYTTQFRLYLGLVIGFFGAVMIYDPLRRQQKTEQYSHFTASIFGPGPIGVAPWSYGILLVLIVVKSYFRPWIWVVSVVAGLAVTIQMWRVLGAISRTERKSIRLFAFLAVLIGLAPLGFRFLSSQDQPLLQLEIAVGGIVLLLVPGLASATLDRRKRTKASRESARLLLNQNANAPAHDAGHRSTGS